MNNTSGINYFFENYTNLDPQMFKIFYDFQQTGSGAAIPSVSFGDGLYSGTINNYAPSFWSYSGSGFFTGEQFITINNSSNNLFSGSNLSFITVAQKSNTNNNILFSCADTGFVGPSFAYRGFTFGLNAANKLYFEYYGPSGLEIFTLPNILAEKNSLSVVLGEDTVTLGQYDFFNQQLNSETFSITSDYLFNGSSWVIGGNPTAPSFDARCGFTGWLDVFMCWNTSLSENEVQMINSGIISDILTTGFISGFVDTIIITGTSTGLVPVFSGVSGWQVDATGIVQDSYGNFYTGIIPPQPLTGVLYGTGITFLTGLSSVAILTGVSDQISINYPYAQSFYYDGVNFSTFPVDINDTVSSYFFTGLWPTTSGIQFLLNSSYNMIKNTFNSNFTGEIVYFLNGQQQNSGALTISGLYSPIKTLEYDYTLSGFNVESLSFYSGSDSNKYDIFFNNQTVIENYSSTGGSLITGGTANFTFFLNGQYLNSGISYYKSGTNYYTLDLYSGTTGNLTIITLPDNLLFVSGAGPSLFSSKKFVADWNILMLNGVRQYQNESYIAISVKDLLSGSGNCVLQEPVIYNNNSLFFS